MTHAADPFWRESDTAMARPVQYPTSVGPVWDDLHVPDDENAPAQAQPPAATAPARMERHHRRTVLRVVLVAQLVLALLTALTVVLAYRHLDANIKAGAPIDHPFAKPTPTSGSEQPKEPLNILVMGSDSRDGAGNDIDGLSGGGERSDTTILIHVSADRQDVYGVSLPRDAVVDRPACRKDGESIPGEELTMFNTAFSVGGPTCTVRMMEELTGIYIDHYVTIDFNGFVDMVDAVHGVTVCIPRDVDDSAHGITFEAGTQVLTGRQALNYVRERYVLSPNSDIGRMKRQQAFIASMLNKVISANTLSNPTRIYGFLNAFTKSIYPDPELSSISKLVDLATQFKHTGLTDIKFVTVPFAAYEPDPNRLVWTAEADDLWERIINDEPLGPRFSDDSISASDPVGTPTGSPSTTPEDQQAAIDAAANGLCS